MPFPLVSTARNTATVCPTCRGSIVTGIQPMMSEEPLHNPNSTSLAWVMVTRSGPGVALPIQAAPTFCRKTVHRSASRSMHRRMKLLSLIARSP